MLRVEVTMHFVFYDPYHHNDRVIFALLDLFRNRYFLAPNLFYTLYYTGTSPDMYIIYIHDLPHNTIPYR